LNTSKTDNNNLPLSLVETLHQLGKDFLEISDNILLYLYLEVSIVILLYTLHLIRIMNTITLVAFKFIIVIFILLLIKYFQKQFNNPLQNNQFIV